MSNWSGGRMTAAGRALQAKVEAGAILEIVRIELGDGNVSLDETENMRALKHTMFSVGIASRTAQDGTCYVTGVTSSSEVETGFRASEMGIIAKDPDEGEILYIATVDDKPDWVPPKTINSKVVAAYALGITVSNASNIQIKFDPNSLTTVEMLNNGARICQRSTYYNVGDLVYDTQLRPGLFLRCVEAGKTSALEINFTGKIVNDEIEDGATTWLICQQEVSTRDCFDRDSNNNVLISKVRDDVERPAEFEFNESTGCIGLVPRKFTSSKFIRDGKGNYLLAIPKTVIPDPEPTEEEAAVATDDDIDSIFENRRS